MNRPYRRPACERARIIANMAGETVVSYEVQGLHRVEWLKGVRFGSLAEAERCARELTGDTYQLISEWACGEKVSP